MWLFFRLIVPENMGSKVLLDEPVVVWGDLTINTVLKIWIISEASRRFAEDRRTGAFELLLSTPLNEVQIIRGQWLALWKQFGLPLLAVLAWDIFLAMGIHRHDPEFGYKHLVATIFLVVDAPALGLTGMWLGLLTGNRNRAILFGLILVLTIPWLAGIGIFEGFTSFTVASTISAQGWSAEIARAQALAALMAWGLADGLLSIWMSLAMRRNFRRIATEGPSKL
jgi:ABC-type transport system involved in cytochrome c biogenesis permease component